MWVTIQMLMAVFTQHSYDMHYFDTDLFGDMNGIWLQMFFSRCAFVMWVNLDCWDNTRKIVLVNRRQKVVAVAAGFDKWLLLSVQASCIPGATNFPWCRCYSPTCWWPIKTFNSRCKHTSVWFIRDMLLPCRFTACVLLHCLDNCDE